MTASARLAELGLTLPPVAVPVAAYVPAVTFGNHVVTSGQLPTVDGRLVATGLVGRDLTPETARDAAATSVLNAVAAIAALAGGVDNIVRIVKIVVFVASVPEFTGQPQVANGASELLGEIFGEAGVHARSAVGVAALPLNAPVEIEVTAEIAVS